MARYNLMMPISVRLMYTVLTGWYIALTTFVMPFAKNASRTKMGDNFKVTSGTQVEV